MTSPSRTRAPEAQEDVVTAYLRRLANDAGWHGSAPGARRADRDPGASLRRGRFARTEPSVAPAS